MRILVFSDTHHNTDGCISVIEHFRHTGVDMILHAGDCNSDAEDISYIYPEIPVKYVQGNNDFSRVPGDLLIEAVGKKIFLTHGHGYRVKAESGTFVTLRKKAEELGADCVVFGHTHEPYCDCHYGIRMLNPGSIKYGRTYAVIEIEDGKLRADVISCS